MASVAGRVAEAGGRVQTFPALVTGGALLALGLARLLPAEGAGLALRLAVAAFLVLLLPGWLALRPFGLPGSFAAHTTRSSSEARSPPPSRSASCSSSSRSASSSLPARR